MDSVSVSCAFVHAFDWINKNKLNRYNSTDQHKTNYQTVYIWLSNILKHLKNPASKLDRELPEVQKKLIESIKQELGDTNLIQSISVSGGKSGKFSKYKNDNPDLFLTLTCKSKFPDCKIWDGCVFPPARTSNDSTHCANKNVYAYTLEALLERSNHIEINNNNRGTKSHYGNSLSDLVDLKGYASEEDGLPDVPQDTIQDMGIWVGFHNSNWIKKEGLSSNNIVDMGKALQAIKWLRQLTSKNYENDNRIGSIYFEAINHVLDHGHESVNVKTPFGSIVEVVATGENEFMNTGLNSSSGLRRGVARNIMNEMPLNRLKKAMRILKTLLDDKSVPSDFLKYNEDQNLIYYNYPNHFSTDIDNAGLTDNERKALDKLFLNLVYFYPRRLKENGKLGRAHIERAYKILHNIK